MNLKKGVYLAIILWLSGQLFGCTWFQPAEEKTAQQLAQKGMEAFQREHYTKSIELFEKLRDWYPFSEHALLAELKLGDAHYHLRQYDEAIVAYEAFESLHPKNEAVPYVVYQIGRCYFDRLQSIDRDQTVTREAIKHFKRLIRLYPDKPLAKKAEQHMRTCYKNLAEHEFYVGEFYYRTGHYKAALERFKTVVSSYPDLGVHHKALQYMALSQSKLRNPGSGCD